MFHIAFHLMSSLPLQAHGMLHSLPHHFAIWQQSLPSSVTSKLGQPDSLTGVGTPHDWKPYSNTFTPDTGGCVDSPEAATLVLLGVGILGLFGGCWAFRKWLNEP